MANLSQIAAGLSGGLVGDSTQNAMTGAEVEKRAVENNAVTPETVWDATNLVIGGTSLIYNIEEGNYGLAVVDGLGLVYDGFATAMPFLPGGVSAGIQAYRTGNSVKQSVAIANDIAKTAKAAHQATKDANNLVGDARNVGSKIHRDAGRRIGEVSGKPLKLSDNANSYFISANKATGKQPDLSWRGIKVWGGLTTQGQWAAYVKKYESSFGITAIPIIYERGKGVTNSKTIRSFGGVGISTPTTIINNSMEDK